MRYIDAAHGDATALMPEKEFFRKLALESSITENVVEFFRDGFPSLNRTLKASVDFFKSSPDSHNSDNHLQLFWFDSKREAVLQASYANYRAVSVAIPEGFTGEFAPYVASMIDCGVALRASLQELLLEYRVIVSSMVTNKTNQLSLKDLTANFNKCKDIRENAAKTMSSYFSADTRSRAKLGTVIPVIRDFRPLSENTRRLESMVTKKSLTEIQRSISEVVQVLDMLENQLQSKDVTDISPKAVKNIAAGAYELAKFVDQLVAFNYAALSIVTCVKSSFEQIKKFN